MKKGNLFPIGQKIRTELDTTFSQNASSEVSKTDFELPSMRNKRRSIIVSLFLEGTRKRPGNNLHKVI